MTKAELMAVVRATGCAVESGGVVFLGEGAAENAQRSTFNAQRSTLKVRNWRPSSLNVES